MSILSLPLFLLIGIVSQSLEAAAPSQAPAPPEAASPAETEAPISPEEAAFNVRSAALGQRVLAVDAEMKSAARLTVLNPDAAKAELDALQGRLQVEMDTFIQDFFNLAAQTSMSLPEAEREILRANVENKAAELATLPRAMRERAEAAAREPLPAEASPSAH